MIVTVVSPLLPNVEVVTRHSLGDTGTQFLHFFFAIRGPTKDVQVALVTSLSTCKQNSDFSNGQ